MMAVLHTRPFSSPVPSESAQSQLLNEDDSDNDIGFATQYPLPPITQASLTTSSTDAVHTTPLTHSHKNANRRLSTGPNSQQLSPPTDHGQMQADVPHSSSESVPFKALSQHTASSDHDSTAVKSRPIRSHSLEESLKSLPLIEQLRAIRKGTNYTRSLGWAKHIESSQRKILDSNDAWQPPLPGKVARDGTVPVVLLEQLTSKADHEAENLENHRATVKGTQDLRTRNVRADSAAVRPVKHHAAGTPLIQVANDDPLAHEVFVDSQEWPASVSPEPPHVLPPDSSPVQPFDGRNPPRSTLPDVDEDTSPVTPSNTNEETSSHLRSKQHATVDDEDIGVQPVTSKIVDRPPLMPDLEISTLWSSTNSVRKAPNVQRRNSDSARTPPATVQAKQTPYIIKAPQVHTELLDEPLSSVINSTYIEPKVRSVAFASTPLPLKKPLVQVSAQKTRDQTTPNGSARSTRKGKDLEHRNTSPDNTPASMAQPPTSSKRQRQSSDASPGSKNSSTPKRRKLPWVSTDNHGQQVNGVDYRDIDQKRELLRRRFYKQYSKSYVRPAESPQDGGRSRRPTLGSASLESFSPPNAWRAVRMPQLSRKASQTSEISSSIHDSPSSDYSVQEALARPINRGTSKPDRITNLLLSYRSVYEAYSGSSKHFRAAVRLLSELKEKNREPHPSLWDDFVFRKHSSYRKYLRDCIEDGESAMPYEKFYHERIAQPKYRAGVLNPANVEAFIKTPDTPSKTSLDTLPVLTSTQASHHPKPSSISSKKVSEYVDRANEKVTATQDSGDNKGSQNNSSSGRTRTQILTDSSRKVSTWLHRAPGAQSPELGSSEAPELPATIVALTEDNLCENATQVEKKMSASRVKRLSRQADSEGVQPVITSNTMIVDFVGKYKKLPGEQPYLKIGSRPFNIFHW